MSRLYIYPIAAFLSITLWTANSFAQAQVNSESTDDHTLNFVRSKTARIPVINESTFNSLSAAQGSITDEIIYVDGTGKLRQSVSLFSTPDSNHMVTPVNYNEIGMRVVSYQPYPTNAGGSNFKENAIEAQASFYNNPPSGVTTNNYPYSVTVHEKSPLLTVKEQGAPGQAWQPGEHTLKTETRTNTVSDEVIIWKVYGTDQNAAGSPQALGYYPANELSVTITTDENGNESEVYTNREGQEVLKIGYLDGGTPVKTYYVYNKFGHLRFIIPPEAVEEIGTNYAIVIGGSNSIRINWITEMRYDAYGRVIEKKIPEAGWVYTVYDKLGRVALTQDANMREGAKNDWFFNKYDIRGRTIMTGVYSETNPSRFSRADMQAHVNTLSIYWESRTSTDFAWQYGYTRNVFPNSEYHLQVWSVTWYDDYDFNNDGIPDEAFIPHNDFANPGGNNLVAHEADLSRTDGQVTGTLTLVLNRDNIFEGDNRIYDEMPSTEDSVYIIGNNIRLKPGFTTLQGQTVNIGPDVQVPSSEYDPKFLRSVSFYDKYGNVIYSKRENHLSGTDESWSLYKFDGLVAETITTHQSASENVLVENRYEYDHAGRVLKEYHNIDREGEKVIAAYSYNELGNMIQKKLHDDVNGYMQTLNYTYHERGWLKSVNNPDNLGNDLFAYALQYEAGSTFPTYNGNISAIRWKTAQLSNETGISTYSFNYDGLNQLVSASYSQQQNLYSGMFSTNYDYDLNGNMKILERNFHTSGIRDYLSYTYAGTGNQVTSISDIGVENYGFKDGASTANEYTYDANGNMIRDDNKGIASIIYNYLNLPEIITFANGNRIEYLYDAAGTKLSKNTFPGGNPGVTTDYANSFVYENGQLGFFVFSEGRVRPYVGITDMWSYEYDLKDHLGNVRATFKVTQDYDFDTKNDYYVKTLVQADSYYPFGLKIPGLSYLFGAEDNKFTYNGKELEDEFGLDWYHYGLRYYDPVVARWWAVDPLDVEHSPYNYSFNDPIRFVDPDGAAPWDIVFNTIDEYGNKRELGRIVTDRFDQEFNIAEKLVPIKMPKNYKPITIDLDKSLERAAEIAHTISENIQAVSLDVSGEAAAKFGLQIEFSVITIIAGQYKGDWGLALQGNGVIGIEASVTGSGSAFWPISNADLSLTDLRGAEIGFQGSVTGLNGAYFEGIGFKRSFPFLYRSYGGASLGVSAGIPELGGSGSVYAGFSGYLYRSDQ